MSAITKHDAPRSPEGSSVLEMFDEYWLRAMDGVKNRKLLSDFEHVARGAFFHGLLKGHSIGCRDARKLMEKLDATKLACDVSYGEYDAVYRQCRGRP